MNPIYGTLIRTILKLAAGALAARGLTIDDGTTETIAAGVIALFGIVWGIGAARKSKAAGADAAKTTPNPYLTLCMLATAAAFLLPGCARFSTRQTDISYNENGQKTRQITTTAKAGTLFEAKSELAQFKANQTDKTQSASVGQLSQDSQGSSSNAVATAGTFLGHLINAASGK